MRNIWAEIDSMEQQGKTKKKAFLSTVKNHRSISQANVETAIATAPTVLTSKETANTSDSQVPIQNTENNPQLISSDVQMDSEPS